MPKEKFYVVATILVVIAGASSALWAFRYSSDRASLLHDQLKEECSVVEVSPYENRAVGVRFAFDDKRFVVCDRRLEGMAGGMQEIYVWRRDAFSQSRPLPFSETIAGG